jgi:hypothetical protein
VLGASVSLGVRLKLVELGRDLTIAMGPALVCPSRGGNRRAWVMFGAGRKGACTDRSEFDRLGCSPPTDDLGGRSSARPFTEKIRKDRNNRKVTECIRHVFRSVWIKAKNPV